MPMKTDGKRRWVEVSTLVSGTPEDVWRMIATTDGMSAWFTPTTIEERVGGAIKFWFAPGMETTGVITAYEPLHRIAYEEHNWSGDAPAIATEVTIESRSGDRCVIRMVHSMATTKTDWDDELDGFEQGWPGFFDILRSCLKHFRGQPAAYAQGWGFTTASPTEAWKQAAESLGLASACVGDRVTLHGASGTVETLHQRDDMLGMQVRVADGIVALGSHKMGDQTRVGALLHSYGPGAADTAARWGTAWEAWATERFSR